MLLRSNPPIFFKTVSGVIAVKMPVLYSPKRTMLYSPPPCRKFNINKIGMKSGRPKFFIPKILSPIPKSSSRFRSPTRKKSGDPNADPWSRHHRPFIICKNSIYIFQHIPQLFGFCFKRFNLSCLISVYCLNSFIKQLFWVSA